MWKWENLDRITVVSENTGDITYSLLIFCVNINGNSNIWWR